jgi:hypothetical protein
LVEIAVNATAAAATDTPPSIQASKLRSLFMGELSSGMPDSAMNIPTVSRLADRGTDANSYLIFVID